LARAPPLQGGCRGFKSLWAHVNKPTANELAEIIEVRYPKSLAVEWDVVGFVTNNSNVEVNKILLTIDVNEEVVAEAIEKSIDLIISHHPLILDPEEISDIQSKRIKTIKRLEDKGIALYVAHTNADIAPGGVNDSLAKTIGLENVEPFGLEKMGRKGNLVTPVTLKEFVNLLKDKLPKVKSSIQVSGKLDSKVFKVALCGGSGSSLLEEVRKEEVDVFVTADLKHHAVSDNENMNGPALVSVSHWASEWTWLPELKKQLNMDLVQRQFNSEVLISEISTDPWNYSLGSH
jgi:dinuclear metal center YbgI/SA1388 family protein